LNWLVIQTAPRREHVARLLLMRDNYETYAPRIRVKKKVSLLFPSYIFVRVVEHWYPVLWTPGVTRLLMSGEVPAQLDGVIVDAIRKREDRHGYVRLPKPQTFSAGDATKILNGPFAGKLAVFQGMTGAERSRVLIALLGGQVSVELPTKDIAAHELVRYSTE
jgi:transcriptional antiterminator RfaH